MNLFNGNNYYLNLKSPIGLLLAISNDFVTLHYARSVNSTGQLEVTLPFYYLPYLQAYGQIEVWRSAGGGVTSPYLDLETLWLIVSWQVILGAEGDLLIKVTAQDGLMVLSDREVAYFAGSSQASKTGYAGDLMKAVVRENVAATANDYTGTANTGTLPRGIPSSFLSVTSDVGDGISVSMSFSWRSVLAVLQDLADASTTGGTYMAFDMVSDGFSKYEFRTYAGQRGVDRRFSSPNSTPVILDPAAGNMGQSSLTYDYTSEATFVYCGGQGEETARTIKTSKNDTRLAVSPFSRREIFQDARQATTATQVQILADAAIRSNRGLTVFDSQVIETPSTRYGIEYGFGDILPCQFQNIITDCRLDKIEVEVTGGQETITTRLQSVN